MNGNAIQALRDESGLTFEQLAQELGVTSGCVMKWKKRDALEIEVVVRLLRYSAGKKLRSSASLFARELQHACGGSVKIILH